MIGHEYLHTPGPTFIPAAVLNALHQQPLDLVDERLLAVAQSCYADMQNIFKTTGSVFFYSGNGHGGWEAALTNICVPGDTVLVVEIGHFSNTWADHARALGVKTDIILGDWRQSVDCAKIEAHLRADTERKIKAVLITHVDTATGITSSIPDVRAAIDAADHPALLVVDAVASLAAVPFEMDTWRVDVTVTASQKALMCPPGLTIVAANERACEISRKLPRHQRYWDWGQRSANDGYTTFGGTMPEHHMFALRAALDIINKEGLNAVFRRHRRLSGAVQSAVEAWGAAGTFEINAVVPAERAVTVTAFRTAPEVDADRIRTYARTQLGLSVAGGLGLMAGKALRIGHMGSLNEGMILGALATFDLALQELKIPRGDNAVQAAINFLATERNAS